MLRQLVISKKIEQARQLLNSYLEEEQKLKTRGEELEKAIEEAQTEEEINLVEEEVNKLEQEKTELEEKKSKLENEIAELEGELEQINSKEPKNKEPQNDNSAQRTDVRNIIIPKIRGGLSAMVNKYETRDQMLERLNRKEVKEFYETIANLVKEKRSVSGADILIPEEVVNMIQTRLGDYSTLYNEVTVQPLSGTARVILDGEIPEAIWVEMTGALSEISTAFSQTELDGYKVGGYIPVSNARLEDSMINLANYLEERLAMAIAKALDKAIINGTGASGKQPTGIITALQEPEFEEHNVTSSGLLPDITSKMALIDDGEDGAAIGEVIAVMKRSLYYSKIAPQTFVNTADGRFVIQNAQAPRLPDGTRIVFNQYTPDNTIILGDFKKYLLGERRGVQIAASTDVRFIEDQTVFKATARYDGKPIYPGYFVKIEIEDTPIDDTPEA